MTLVPVRAFVQARMSSRRFPGKVLAPFRGAPLVRHVVCAVEQALPSVPVTVLTSTDPTDDPLAAYLERVGVAVFRGSLDDVVERFRDGLRAFPCGWVLRICADSPLLDGGVLRAVVARADEACDVVTTIFPRTFPAGYNAELIRGRALESLDPSALTAEEREHVTPFFYRHAERFRIINLTSGEPRLAELKLTVDSVEDLWRLERLTDEEIPRFPFSRASAVRG